MNKWLNYEFATMMADFLKQVVYVEQFTGIAGSHASGYRNKNKNKKSALSNCSAVYYLAEANKQTQKKKKKNLLC